MEFIKLNDKTLQEIKTYRSYPVGGKTITVRMSVFLQQMCPEIYDIITTENERIANLIFIEKTTIRLITASHERGCPLNTIHSFKHAVHFWKHKIMSKDLETRR